MSTIVRDDVQLELFADEYIKGEVPRPFSVYYDEKIDELEKATKKSDVVRSVGTACQSKTSSTTGKSETCC